MGSCDGGHTPSVKHFALAAVLLCATACEDGARALPGSFALGLPADGATVPAEQLSFTWSESAGATGYVLEIDRVAPRAVLGLSVDGRDLALTPGTTYAWRVAAASPGGSVVASNAPFHFTVAPDAPPAFMQQVPTAGASGVPLQPAFRWTASPGASRYVLQVASDASFSTIVGENDSVPPDQTSAMLDAPLPAGTPLYWRVLAVDSIRTTPAANAPSLFTTASAPGDFAALSPAPGATDVPLSPAFSWSASAGADGYSFSLDSAAPIELSASTTSFTPANPLESAKAFTWHVIAHNAQGTRDISASFTTATGPGAFSLTSPLFGVGGQTLQPMLAWTASASATAYSVQLGTDPALTAPLVYEDDMVTATSVTVPTPLDPNTTYYWRVTALDAAGTRVADAAPFSFTTAPLPTVPMLLGPYMGFTGISNIPLFSWVPAQFADDQTLEVALDGAFTNVVLTFNLPASASDVRLTLANALAGSTQYYWRVSATGPAGSVVSTVFPFTTGVLPAPFMLLTPYTWTRSTGATSIEMQLATDPGFTDLALDVTLPGTAIMYTPDINCPLPPGTTLYWRVIAKVGGSAILASNAPVTVTTPATGVGGNLIWAFENTIATSPYVSSAFAIDSTGVYLAPVASNTLMHLQKLSLSDGSLLWDQLQDATTLQPVALVTSAGSVFVVNADFGGSAYSIRIEKRSAAAGDLDTTFGASGVVESRPSTDTVPFAAASDGTSLYVAGNMNGFFYVEKRALDTGALDPAFGTGGYLTSDTGSGSGADYATGIALLSPTLYLFGRETLYDPFGDPEVGWRVEARAMADGTLVGTFGDGGVLEIDPSPSDDDPGPAAAQPGALFLAGDDRNSGEAEWYEETVDPLTGSGLAAFSYDPDPVWDDTIIGVAGVGASAYLVGDAANDKKWRIAATNDPSWGNNGSVQCVTAKFFDHPTAVVTDSSGVYVLGVESDTQTTGWRWRVEKRQR
jgi:hypothetical protein